MEWTENVALWACAWRRCESIDKVTNNFTYLSYKANYTLINVSFFKNFCLSDLFLLKRVPQQNTRFDTQILVVNIFNSFIHSVPSSIRLTEIAHGVQLHTTNSTLPKQNPFYKIRLYSFLQPIFKYENFGTSH